MVLNMSRWLKSVVTFWIEIVANSPIIQFSIDISLPLSYFSPLNFQPSNFLLAADWIIMYGCFLQSFPQVSLVINLRDPQNLTSV